ncbi:glycosyltransferase [Nitrincola sp. MINF-07-Sa-05]|uniref:glycosyltransferase n=1 Tax=Nitrincola salilacus TaxID=3400273 RepID=UPI0039184C5B
MMFDQAVQQRLIASGLFDEQWYTQQYPDVALSGYPAWEHFVQLGSKLGRNPGPGFDGQLYLSANTDVAAAGINPLLHYLGYGWEEGRPVIPPKVSRLEYYLWRGLAPAMQPRLERIVGEGRASSIEVGYARWALARWYAWQQDWPAVDGVLQHCYPLAGSAGIGPFLLRLQASLHLAELDEAEKRLATLKRLFPDAADTLLAESNYLAVRAQYECQDESEHLSAVDSQRLSLLNQVYAHHGLLPLSLQPGSDMLMLDNLGTDEHSDQIPLDELTLDQAHLAQIQKVSVIVPVFNAATTLPTALNSLLAQTWPRIEILLVDDASEDNSWEVMQAFKNGSRPDIELVLLRHEVNQGAYPARNTALAAATGDFITVHDSDDWSHPQKIECQVQALLDDPDSKACWSSWARCTDDLYFDTWYLEPGWVRPNISSLMFRREVFDQLGYWDRVRVSGDTEYHQRIVKAYGAQSVLHALPDAPLAFGRMSAESLTQTGATHLVTQFMGLRKDYEDAFRRWHDQAASLYCSDTASSRLFPAPQAQVRNSKSQTHPSDLLIELQDPRTTAQLSDLFDSAWYTRCVLGLEAEPVDPFQHYWSCGVDQGLDPGPEFSTSGYLRAYAEHLEEGEHPLLHFIEKGRLQGLDPCPEFAGEQAFKSGRPTLLLVAHMAKATLYGAERSLLDTLRALAALDINVMVMLPSAANSDYVDQICALACRIKVQPYGWWMQGFDPCEATIRQMQAFYTQHAIDYVYVNTLVLCEPLIAAKQLGLPVWLHVRELLEYDPALQQILNAGQPEVAAFVMEHVDQLICNSLATAEPWQDKGKPIHLLYNTLPMQPLLMLPEPVSKPSRDVSVPVSEPMRVVMISSNTEKKGVVELYEVARLCSLEGAPIEFYLYGEDTPLLRQLLEQATEQGITNMVYAGYTETPLTALQQADLLVSLSVFRETFGRTVLEAMAAARPVICYNWGALPELVQQDETGYLVPFMDVQAVAERLLELARDPALCRRLGQAGRQRAVTVFGEQVYAQAWEKLCARLM